MKKLLLAGLSIAACFCVTGCENSNEASTNIEQVVEYLNADAANYEIQTISTGCCQYAGAVDGDIIKREKTHYEYKEDGKTTDYTTFTTYYYDVTDNQNYTMYTSNTTASNATDVTYKTLSSWTSAEKAGAVAPYLLSFNLCACCSEKTLNKEEYTFTFTEDEEDEVNAVYSSIVIDLTEGLEKVSVTLVLADGTTTYKITNFNTVDLEIPCTEDCTE